MLLGNELSGWFTATHILVLTNMVLAAVALLTIRSSNRVARASEQQAVKATEQTDVSKQTLEQERAALLASVRPVVAEFPLGISITDERRDGSIFTPARDQGQVSFDCDQANTLSLIVPIRNIGAGPAFVHHARVKIIPSAVVEAIVSHEVIPSDGERAIVWIDVPEIHPYHEALFAAERSGGLDVAVFYSDLDGVQRTQTVLHIEMGSSSNPWRDQAGFVSGIQFYECDTQWVPADDPINRSF